MTDCHRKSLLSKAYVFTVTVNCSWTVALAIISVPKQRERISPGFRASAAAHRPGCQRKLCKRKKGLQGTSSRGTQDGPEPPTKPLDFRKACFAVSVKVLIALL